MNVGHHKSNNQSKSSVIPGTSQSPAAGRPAGRKSNSCNLNSTLQRISELVSQGNFERAFQLLNAKATDMESLNAKAVCLLRLGRYTDAINVFRKLVLNPGCIWMRPECPLIYKTNFATALLLGGHPAGCIAVLSEIGDEDNPSVLRLRSAIKRWEETLSFWQRLNWRWFVLEPEGRPVHADFVPGEFLESASMFPKVSTPSTQFLTSASNDKTAA